MERSRDQKKNLELKIPPVVLIAVVVISMWLVFLANIVFYLLLLPT